MPVGESLKTALRPLSKSAKTHRSFLEIPRNVLEKLTLEAQVGNNI